jgi:hypothetical protein
MNYCVSGRQPKSVIKLADEVMVDYKDIEILFDFMKDFPNKKYIIRVPRAQEIDWKQIKLFKDTIDLTIALEDLRNYKECVNHNIPFYWAYTITTYEDLNCIAGIGASQALISGPLYFDLKEVSKRGLKIRLIANLCYDGFIPHLNGINGTYVRPDDVPAYEPYVSTLEFRTDALSKEATLLNIYSQMKEWKGNLNLLLSNFNFDVDNRAIPVEFAEARIQCRQDCQRAGRCRFCFTAMDFSRAIDKNRKQWVVGDN